MLRGIRVYELARELDISSKDILRLLSDKMHIEMNNHMATLNDQVVARLRQLVAEERGQDGAQKAGTRGPRPSADEPRPAPEAAGGAPQSGARAPAPTPRAPAPGNHPPAAVRPPAAAAPLGGRAAARPGAPAVRSTPPPPRSGPVHFRPAPGLLPLVTPRPTPPRPRRPQPRPEPAPTLTHSPAAAETPQPEAPVPAPAAAAPVPQEPQTAPQRVEPAAAPAEGAPIPAAAQEAHPAEAPAAVPPEPQSTREEPREVPPEPERAAPPEPEPVRAAAQQAPTAPSEEPATGTGQQLAPAVSHPTPAVARPSLPIVTQSAAARARPEVESGAAPARALLPVRRVQPGQPPPLRYPDRPLLPVRKVDPNAPRPAPAASSAPATATAPAAGHPGAGRRGRRGEHVGVPAEGGGTTLDVRRRGGAGRRPARPGAVTAGEGEWGEAGRRLRRRRGRRLAAAAAEAQAPVMPESVTFSGPVLVSELAEMLSVGAPEVIRKLLDRGVMAAIHHQVDVEHARAVAEDYGISVQVAGGAGEEAPATVDRDTLGALLAGDDPHRVEPRPPIVTVLGHVDHGKTTLLDAIRKTRVAAGEAGGITQHIGAYRVRHGERTVVFLDTPGHEAFTAMRARGAQVTDIAVLVVAADDGVMPQTREALSHARAAGVPVVVALNKVDKPDANVDRVLQQLSEVGLVPEAWGGDSIVVPVSALKGEGIDALLEMLLLVADMEDLRADPQRAAVGTVIEAEVSRGRGPVATVLVQSG